MRWEGDEVTQIDELYDYNYLYDKGEKEKKNYELNRIIQQLRKKSELKVIVNNNDPGNKGKTEKETEDNKGGV